MGSSSRTHTDSDQRDQVMTRSQRFSISLKTAYVLDADISGCFDHIDHKTLLQKLDTFPKMYRKIKDWLRSGIMEGIVFQKSRAGTPQGGVISPLLANIALHGLEYGTKAALKMDLFNYKKQVYGKASYMHSQHSYYQICR